MISKPTRLALPLWLALSVGFAFTPVGCGGGTEEAVPPPYSAPERPTLPDEMAAQFKDCINERAARLTSDHYAIQFNVKATKDGDVKSAEVKDSILGDPEIEACMVDALQGMTLPASVKAMLPARPVSGRAVTPESRTLVGNALAAGGVIVQLLPIVIVAAGITVVVGVTILLVIEATTSLLKDAAERERCRKVNEACQIKCLPELRKKDYGANPFHKCMRECREAEGCWEGIY